MPTLTIDITFTGDTPASVALLTLTDAASGADLSGAAGLTLPAAFTLANGHWSRAFTDTGATAYAYTYRVTWADGSFDDLGGTKRAGTSGATLTSRTLIEATGKVNADVWADIDADANAANIAAQFDRVVSDAQDAAREAADDAGALALWPLDPSDAQYAALVRAATDFAVARLQQMRPEPVAAGKEPVGVTGERVAREKMEEIWDLIRLRDTPGVARVRAPVAEARTYYPVGYGRLTTYGPFCG